MKSKVDEFLDEIIIRKGDKEVVLREERIRELVSEFIERLGEEAKMRNDFSMSAKFVSLLIDIKKVFWPATQKSVQANIDFNESLEKWYKLQKQLLEEKKKEEEKKKQLEVEFVKDAS